MRDEQGDIEEVVVMKEEIKIEGKNKGEKIFKK